MSGFQYPARRFKGLAGTEYYRARKGYGGAGKGDIIFEVMESRAMPRWSTRSSGALPTTPFSGSWPRA